MRIDWTEVIVSETICITVSDWFHVDFLLKYWGRFVQLTRQQIPHHTMTLCFVGRLERILQQEWNDFECSWTKLRLRHIINDIHLYDLIFLCKNFLFL